MNTETNKKTVNGLVYDRYSIVFILILSSFTLFFLLGEELRKYAAFIGAIGMFLGGYVSSQAACIRKNNFIGDIQYKGENDCEFSSSTKDKIYCIKTIGIARGASKTFKAPMGTDIVIDAEGNVNFAGWGSRFVSGLR